MSGTDVVRASAAGRPRDSRIDEAILEATRALLVEVGYSALALTAVAARAGTSVPALRRRWSTKAHLVHEAVFVRDLPTRTSDRGTLEQEVRRVVDETAVMFSAAAARQAIPGLIADFVADDSLQSAVADPLRVQVWAAIAERLHGVIDESRVRVMMEMIVGAAQMASVMRGDLDDAWCEALTAQVLYGVSQPAR